MTLLPTACAINISGEWDGNGGETSDGGKLDCVTVDDGSSHFLQENYDQDNINFRFESTPVASGAIDSITSVQMKFTAQYPYRGSGNDVRLYIDHFPSALAAENFTIPSIPVWQYVTGAVHTTNSSGGTISYSDIQGIGLDLKKQGTIGSNVVRITYVTIEVVYVAAAGTDNAIFFGTNF